MVFALLLAMAALGLSMIFGTTGLTNFAHGELITFGALAAYFVDSLPGNITIGGTNVTVAVAIVVAAIASAGFGWLNDKALWRPLRRRGTGLIAMMVVSIGLSIFLRNIYQYFAGAEHPPVLPVLQPAAVPPRARSLVTPKDIFVVLFSLVVLVSVVVALQRTRLGKATRAVADNTALARRHGHQRGPGHLGGVDRRRDAGRPVRGAARDDPGLRLPARLQDPAAGVRRHRARRPRHGLGRHRRCPHHRPLRRGLDAVRPGRAQVRRRTRRAHRRPADQAPGPARQGRSGSVKEQTWTGTPSSARALQQGLGPVAAVYCLAAIGLNVHFGYTGLLNFGQAGFMAVGGYAVAVVRRHLGALVLAGQPGRAWRPPVSSRCCSVCPPCGCAPTTSRSSRSRRPRSSGRPSGRSRC